LSAFLGFVEWATQAIAPSFSQIGLPDHPGLGPQRSWARPYALFLHKQRSHTPEDLLESQPTPAWGNRGCILFDGRLDDRDSLSQELGIAPSERLSDSQLVAVAFEKWGDDAPSHLIGDFVVAAWDDAHRRLTLASDASGTRQLYFRRANGHVAFSTLLPALLSMPGIPRQLDDSILANLIVNNYSDTRESFFRGIYRVLGGTTVVLTCSSERVFEYWKPAGGRSLILRNDDEYVEAAREVLDRSVKSRLRSIQPVPLMGSGGLDSSCIAVSALSQSNGASLPIVTVVPEFDAPTFQRPGHYVSERHAVLTLQKAFPRLRPEFLEPDRRPDIAFRPQTIFEEAGVPIRNVVNAGWADVAHRRIREMGATSYLNGAKGNSTLTWIGTRLLGSLFRQGRWLRMASEAAALSDYRAKGTLGQIWQHALKPHLRSSLRKDNWQGLGSLHPDAIVRFDMARRMRNRLTRSTITSTRAMREFGLVVSRAFVGESRGWLRIRHGLELRDPLNDSRLIDFCMSIPEDQFLRKGQTRWLARRLLNAAGVPAEITQNTSRGEWAPDWFTHLERRKTLLPLEIGRLRNSPIASRLIDVDRLARIVADWPTSPDAAHERRLELDVLLTRALQVGAFIQWAETKYSSVAESSANATAA
jgi:asparagine synthase (glutamine-hydrolysing)